jgi:hypothetical protein
VNIQGEELGGGMSPPMKKHLEFEIMTLENAPRHADKLERLLQVKQRQKEEEAMHTEDTERLVKEIEMLRVVLFLVASRVMDGMRDAWRVFRLHIYKKAV